MGSYCYFCAVSSLVRDHHHCPSSTSNVQLGQCNGYCIQRHLYFNVPKSPGNTIPELLKSSFNVQSLNDSLIVDNLNGFEAFFKLVVAFFSFSSALSFILFIYALVCTYKCAGLRRFWRTCTRNRQPDEEPRPLDPFQYNGSETSTSTCQSLSTSSVYS